MNKIASQVSDESERVTNNLNIYTIIVLPVQEHFWCHTIRQGRVGRIRFPSHPHMDSVDPQSHCGDAEPLEEFVRALLKLRLGWHCYESLQKGDNLSNMLNP